MTRGDLKTSRTGSRTPFQILADYYQTGDTRDRALWTEYSRATGHLAAVRWSRELRAIMLGLGARRPRSEEELATKDVDGTLVVRIEMHGWSEYETSG